MSTVEQPIATLSDLRTRLTGRVVESQDPDYDALRQVMLGGTDPHPAVIVRPRTDADVARAVTVARETGLPLAVRSGGHSSAAHGSVDGGLVIDLREMTALDVDAAAGTVWAEAGLTAGEVTEALAEHGLAVGFGDTGSVGIGGITVGGGVGYLSRRIGLTIDNLLAADVVTADGHVLRVDVVSHPDLFWAIRGGGGNFGVATRFQYRTHPVSQVVGGVLVLPATAEVVAGFVAAAQAAPDELSTIANVMPCPPMPFVPAELHGRLVVMALLCFSGAPDDADAALAPFRALTTPLMDMIQPIPYPAMFMPEDPDYRPTVVSATAFLDHVDEEVAAAMVDRLATAGGMAVVQLRVLGGAIARVSADATAYAHRSARIMVYVAAFVDAPEDRAARTQWVEELGRALDQGVPGAYVNFIGDHGAEGARAAYPGETWDRLARIKATYDPTNLFRRNQNVPPAAVS